MKELENKNEKINRLYLDMQNEITGEQGDLIDHIDRNMEEVRANVVVANEQLD